MGKTTSRLQVANQRRWVEEGQVKSTCALFRNLMLSQREGFTSKEYAEALVQISKIETIMLTNIRNTYERVRDEFKRTSTSSEETITK